MSKYFKSINVLKFSCVFQLLIQRKTFFNSHFCIKKVLIFFSRSNESILSFLIESGAKVSEAGWMQITDDQLFGTPLVLAHWLHIKPKGHLISEKILKTISNEHQRLYSNFPPKSKKE
jgi:hypothetical protein